MFETRNDSFLSARSTLTLTGVLAKVLRQMAAFETYSIKPGPGGLVRIGKRALGEAVRRSWVVRACDAEDAVLDEWAEVHDVVLGYPPNW